MTCNSVWSFLKCVVFTEKKKVIQLRRYIATTVLLEKTRMKRETKGDKLLYGAAQKYHKSMRFLQATAAAKIWLASMLEIVFADFQPRTSASETTLLLRTIGLWKIHWNCNREGKKGKMAKNIFNKCDKFEKKFDHCVEIATNSSNRVSRDSWRKSRVVSFEDIEGIATASPEGLSDTQIFPICNLPLSLDPDQIAAFLNLSR